MLIKPWPLVIENNYREQGGWKCLVTIFSGQLSYEDKMNEVKGAFGVSLYSAKAWYGKWRNLPAAARMTVDAHEAAAVVERVQGRVK